MWHWIAARTPLRCALMTPEPRRVCIEYSSHRDDATHVHTPLPRDLTPESSLRVSPVLESRNLPDGTVAVWSTEIDNYTFLPADAARLLSAIATAPNIEEAARSASLPLGEATYQMVRNFQDLGLIQSRGSDQPMLAVDQLNADSQAHFRNHGDSWTDRAYGPNSSPDHYAQQRLALTVNWLREEYPDGGASVLDLGCGAGQLAIELARLGFRVSALDSATTMLDATRLALDAEPPVVRERVELLLADLIHFDREQKFDLVVALGIVPHFDDVRCIFQCAARLLRPGGRFLLNGPNKFVANEGPRWTTWPSLMQHAAAKELRELSLARWKLRHSQLSTDFFLSLCNEVDNKRPDSSPGNEILTPACHRLPGRRRTTSMSVWELQTNAAAHGFVLDDLLGCGFSRTTLDFCLPEYLATACSRPLRALRELPLSLLWMTGFLAVLRSERDRPHLSSTGKPVTSTEIADPGRATVGLARPDQPRSQELVTPSNSPSAVLWLTGLSGAGKSTVAEEITAQLRRRGLRACLLDGDRLRQGLCRDLGYTVADREENIRRASHVAALLASSGSIVVASFISPSRSHRAAARSTIHPLPFFEIFVDCPLPECIRRDPKGLYRKARDGKLPDFTGISAPYEVPERPDVHLHSSLLGPPENAARVVTFLLEESGLLHCRR
jgi:adenylylsulfate kinase